MAQKFMMKKIITALIMTAFLSVNSFAAEAAPPKKGGGYPYPNQQQSQQKGRPSTQQPRPASPRPTMQQPRQNVARPRVQQPRPASPRPTMQQPRQNVARPRVQQPRPASSRPTMQQSQQNVARPKLQQQQNVARPRVQQPRPASPRPTMQQPRQNVARPKLQQPRPASSHSTMQQPKQNVAKPKVQQPRPSSPRPTMQQPKQNVAKQDTHKPKQLEQRKPGPRTDLHRPPVHRTYENMHKWRRAPKPPKDHWWNHRPAYRRGRYRGYYNGIYYTDVVSALLTAEIIHSAYDYSPATVINYADYSARAFIPKEAVKYKGHHYLVFSDIGKSMEDAQQFCESMGGHLAEVGDEGKNARLYRLINDSGFDNEYFEKYGSARLIPNEPVTYIKVNPDSSSEEEEYYGLYYWNYKDLREDGTSAGTGGNAFVCEWDM